MLSVLVMTSHFIQMPNCITRRAARGSTMEPIQFTLIEPTKKMDVTNGSDLENILGVLRNIMVINVYNGHVVLNGKEYISIFR